METVRNKKLINFNRKKMFDLIFYIALLTPPILSIIVFYIIVHANSIRMAFCAYDAETKSYFWNNFGSFGRVFKELAMSKGTWSIAFKNSYLLYGLGWLTHTPINFILCYFIYKHAGIGGWFKVALFIPTIMSSMVTLIMFKYFANNAIPAMLQKITNSKEMIPGLLTMEGVRFWTMWLHGFFTGFGSGLLLYLNAMKAISPSIVEAAHLDGITYWGEFYYITLPLIFSTWRVFIVTGVAGILGNQFGGFQLFGESAPPDIQTVGYKLYVESVTRGDSEYPFLSAFGLLISLLTMVPTMFARWLTERIDPVEN